MISRFSLLSQCLRLSPVSSRVFKGFYTNFTLHRIYIIGRSLWAVVLNSRYLFYIFSFSLSRFPRDLHHPFRLVRAAPILPYSILSKGTIIILYGPDITAPLLL